MNDEDRRTLWCGNLSEKTTVDTLYELFLQAGPLEKVAIPKERDGRQRNYAFITYLHEVSVQYAMELFRGTELYQRTLSLQFRGGQGPKHPSFKADIPPLIDFSLVQNDIQQRFEEMTNQIVSFNPLPVSHYVGNQVIRLENQDVMSHLSAASLQGNWSTRHHPYQRDEFREPKGRFGSNQRNEKHWDGGHHGRNKNHHRRFNDDHRGGGYSRGHGNKNR